jgi:N-alpha-acetyltransferase 40
MRFSHGRPNSSYELQLSPQIQGSGLGKQLMTILEFVGKELGAQKAMLTVFTLNVSALSFYTALGYITSPVSPFGCFFTLEDCVTHDRYTVDAISPKPRARRRREVVQPDYKILSKSLMQSPQTT